MARKGTKRSSGKITSSSKNARDDSPIRTKKRRFTGSFDLDQLQMLIRRNPQLYRDDFLRQLEAFRANTELFRLSPNIYLRQFDLLTSFVMRLAHLFPEDVRELPNELFTLLREFGKVMDPKLRNTFVQGLVHLRTKNVVSQLVLYPAFIKLASTADKALRTLLESFIINDVMKTARKQKDLKITSQLQALFGNGVQDDNPHISKLSIHVLAKLYTKNTWNDAKTVNLIAEGCFAKNSRTSAFAVQFFLGKDEAPDGDDDSDEENGNKGKGNKSEKQLLLSHRVGRKTHKREKRLERARRVLKKNHSKNKRDLLNYSAINLLYDPQSFAEKLYAMLVKSNQKYETRLNVMSLISRLIGTQNLILLNFYPFMQKYLQPRQRDVTKVLLFVAQASHPFVPPDCLEAVLRTIADNFITDAHAAEVVAVGLNAIREIVIRCPLALNEDLAGDLIGYRKHRDKIVQMAARSLVQAIRDNNPGILRRKDRGRPTEDVAENEAGEGTVPVFGATTKARDYIPGAEVLFKENGEDEDEEEEDDDNSSSTSGAEDSEDGSWVDVSSESDKGGSDEWVTDDESGDDDSEGEDKSEDEDESSEENDETAAEKKVKEVLELPAKERIEMARLISSTKILDDKDFDRVRKMQLAKSLTSARKRKTKEGVDAENSDDEEGSEDEKGDLPNLNDIERGCGNRREHDKAARMASVLKGREGREKFGGGGKKRLNPMASTTNREKQRNKAFLMVRQKIMREKNRKSFQAKQARLHNALLKLAKRGK